MNTKDILRHDDRACEIIQLAGECYGLIFDEIIGFENGTFTDKFTKESVDCTTYVVSFWNLQHQLYVQGSLLLLHGSFSIPAANFCSGWLVFEDSDYPEIRFLRQANEAIVFTGVYSREDLVKMNNALWAKGKEV